MRKLLILILFAGFISCKEAPKKPQVEIGKRYLINRYMYDEDPFRTDTIKVLNIVDGYVQYEVLSGLDEGDINSQSLESSAYIIRPIK